MLNMDDNIYGSAMPMGLGFALAQNMAAMEIFSSLDKKQQQQIIENTHQIQSKSEMQQYVDQIEKGRP